MDVCFIYVLHLGFLTSNTITTTTTTYRERERERKRNQ